MLLLRLLIRFQIFFILALAAITTGCGTTSMSVSKNFMFKSNDSHGLVIISTKWISPLDSQFMPAMRRIPISNADDFFGHVLNVKNMLITPDFTNPPGYFYITKLEAGTYAISSANTMKDSIRFIVNAGEIVYAGELEFRHVIGCKHISRPGCEPDVESYVVSSVNNRWDRDKDLTRERLKNYSTDLVTVRLAKTFKN